MDVSTPYDTVRDAPLRADTLKEAIDSIADRTPTPPNRETMRLRALLDERGIEHDDNDANTEVTGVRITRWKNGGKRDVRYEEWRNGTTRLDAGNVSPEQAIAAKVGAGTVDKASERIELLASLAREYLHRYGTLMAMMGDDVTEETLAVESVICEVAGKFRTMTPDEADDIAATVDVETCCYTPDDCGFTWWDENDVEHHEEDSAADDCGSAICDKCGQSMLVGDCGWFKGWDEITEWWDEHGRLHKGYFLKPDFKYCPNCGCKVVSA